MVSRVLIPLNSGRDTDGRKMPIRIAHFVLIPLNSGRDTDRDGSLVQEPVQVLFPLNSGRDTDYSLFSVDPITRS